MRCSSFQAIRFLIASFAPCLALACGESASSPVSNGGSTSKGGNLGSGGSASGGTGGSGGQISTGGNGSSGGSVGSGGISSAGGALATGGTVSTGGASTGGALSAGGISGFGGAPATGGSTARNDAGDAASPDGNKLDGTSDSRTGGAGGTGGVPATGGATGTGGSTSTDGGANSKIKVWLAGDSTVMNCSSTCPCGWGSQFQSLLNSNATVVNSAAGGRSIQTWLYDPNVTTTMDSTGECVVNPKTYSARWQAMIDPTNGMKPGDYLFIEFGINDTDSTCNRHVGTALFQSYLGVMAKAAKALGAQPIFLTATSYIGCSGSTATANRGFGTQIKAAGTENNVPVIDLTTLSAKLYTSLGLCPNDGNYASTTSALGKFFCDDHTHFEAAGAAQIAGVVAKALKDQGIGLAAYLK